MPPNAFAQFVRRYSKDHPKLSGPELMRKAAAAYRAQGGGSRQTAGSRKRSKGRRPDIATPVKGSVFQPVMPEIMARRLGRVPASGIKRGQLHSGIDKVRKL